MDALGKWGSVYVSNVSVTNLGKALNPSSLLRVVFLFLRMPSTFASTPLARSG